MMPSSVLISLGNSSNVPHLDPGIERLRQVICVEERTVITYMVHMGTLCLSFLSPYLFSFFVPFSQLFDTIVRKTAVWSNKN